jgi:hypothetical protein
MIERDSGVMLGHRWLLEKHAKLPEKHDVIRWMIPPPQGFMCVVATRRTRRNINLAPQRNISMNANEIFFGLEFESKRTPVPVVSAPAWS